jgi:hypothetical protein
MNRPDILQFPLDYMTGARMTEDEQRSVVGEVGHRLLLVDEGLRTEPGLLGQKIYEQTGAGVGFALASIFALEMSETTPRQD